MVSRATTIRFAVLLAFFSMLLALAPPLDTGELSDSEGAMDTSGRSGPDLTVDYISASWTSADAGDSKSISTRIKNEGDASSGSFRWGLYLSTDTNESGLFFLTILIAFKSCFFVLKGEEEVFVGRIIK